jgi:hypothetical protein
VLQDTKFSLSEDQLELIRNKQFLLEKRIVTQKIADFMGELDRVIRHELQKSSALPLCWEPGKPGKISRGDNLSGLPFLVLDQPAYFSPEGHCALRTLFWWGHYFLISYLVSGTYLERLDSLAFDLLPDQVMVYTGTDPWENDREQFTKLVDTDALFQAAKNRGFLKLAVFFPLEKHDQLAETLIRFLKAITGNK